MSALLDAALAYAARGWPVFPCTPGAKTPAGQLVHRGVLDASTDPAQIAAWWTAEPDANIGIATGSPGPDVIDVDVKEGGSGWDALARITTAGLAGAAAGYVRTPSGGLHAYYSGTSQRNGSIRKQRLDFRAAGGYVLAAPSAVGGKPYELTGSLDIDRGPVDWFAIRACLDPPPDPVPFAQPARARTLPDGELRPGDDWAARTSWAEILQPRGWRRTRDLGNGRAMWRRPGKKDGSSATTREDGGLYVFTSSTEFEVEVPYGKFGAMALLEHGGDHAAAASALRARGYGTPLPAPAITFAQPQQPAGGQQDDAEPAEAGWWDEIAARHEPLDWARLWDDTPEDEDWIIEPLLAAGRSIALYSPPKAGKSLVTLEIVAALAAGRPVLGQPAGRLRKVLYVDLENSRRDIRDRLDALGYKPHDLAGLVYLSFPSLPVLDSADGGREIVALAIAHKADVVVIDTVSRVIAGKENDADTFAALYRFAMAPLKGMGVAVMRLDHAGKDIGRGQRGSSAKNADVDAVWTLTAAGPVVTLRCEMSRTQLPAEVVNLRRESDPLRHEITTASHADQVAEMVAQLDELGVPDSATRREAEAALRAAGHKVRTVVAGHAVNARKVRFPGSRSPGTRIAGTRDDDGSGDREPQSGNSTSADAGTKREPREPSPRGVAEVGSPGQPHVRVAAGNQADARPDCCHRCGEIGGHSPGCEAAA